MASKNVNRARNFGSIPHDPNRQLLSNFKNYFMTSDATDTPQSSPITVAANADTTIVVPAAAVEVMIISSVALRISEQTPDAAPYFVIPANTPLSFPCMTPTMNSQVGNIYLRGDSAQAVVQFMFLCV